ncbi:MAG: hypothetical protein HKL99_14235 [Burkholderiales bacterium]|nr:hypothetical protein [Burkholderiales bacterium]
MANTKASGAAPSGGSDLFETLLWSTVLGAILVGILWLAFHRVVQYAVLSFIYWGVLPFTMVSRTAGKILVTITSHPYAFWGPGRLFTLFDVASALYWRWPVAVILFAFGVASMVRSKRLRYSTRLTLEQLAVRMVGENPHIAPTLKLNAYEQPLDGGLLPAPERPVAFAVRRGLLLDGEMKPVTFDAIFARNGTIRDFRPEVRDGRHPIGDYVLPARVDEARATQVFAAQLRGGFKLRGKTTFSPRSDLRLLPGWAQALAAALYAFGADRQDDANAILAHLSLGWRPPTPGRAGGWQWRGLPLAWRAEADLLDGRIDWVATKDPANPVMVSRDYVHGTLPGWPAALSPVVRIERARNESGASVHGFDWVWRLQRRWRGPVWAKPLPSRAAGFEKLPTGYREINAQMLRDERFQEVVRLHDRHCATWFMALMEWAQRMGSFHTSLFIWLRVQNPQLFWVLNHVGGECAWTQAAGPWTHYRNEIMARSAIDDPAVDIAVQALVKDLSKDGWLDPREGR